MSNNNSKDSNSNSGANKRGLSKLVLVVVGAALGGIGVVFAVPPKEVKIEVPQRQHDYVLVQHPDAMEFRFNPRTESGKAVAQVNFTFRYKVREDLEERAVESIGHWWEKAYSNVIMLLRARTVAEFNRPDFDRVLQKDIMDELDVVLFPGSKQNKVASVVEVSWQQLRVH